MSTPENKASTPSRAEVASATKQGDALVLQNYIQKQLQEVVENAPETAVVNVVVTKFFGLKETSAPLPLTQCSLVMPKPNPRVKIVKDDHGEDSVQVIPEGGPVCFQYKISGTAADDTYYPIGISFCPIPKTPVAGTPAAKTPVITAASQAVARKNFSTDAVHIYGTSLFFTDSFCADADKLGYRFCLIVQSVKTAEVGVIDPGLGNPAPPGKLA